MRPSRETLQRYGLVAVVVVGAAVFARVLPSPLQLLNRHRAGSSCRVERHVERHVRVHGEHGPHRMMMPPAPPAPPAPPSPPAPPAPPAPPRFDAMMDVDAEVERDMARFEREMAQFEVDMERHAAQIERDAEQHARQAERHARAAARQAERQARHVRPTAFSARPGTVPIVRASFGSSAPTAAVAARPDEVLVEREFRVRAGDRLDVGLSSEDVVVETGSGTQATVTVRGSGRDVRREFERRRFEIGYADGRLRVRTNPERSLVPRMGRTDARFTVVIRVPEQFDGALNTSSGDVRVGRLAGDLSVNTSSGNVALAAVRGAEIAVNTSSGDVSATALDGNVNVNTSSGNVTAGRVAGQRTAVQTSSGDVTFEAVEASRFEASTSSGNVTVDRLAGAASVHTSSGDVTLALARVAATDVSTSSGEVALGLPRGSGAEVRVSGGAFSIDDALGFRGTRQRRSAEGRLGGGGPLVAVSTGSGGIALRAQ